MVFEACQTKKSFSLFCLGFYIIIMGFFWKIVLFLFFILKKINKSKNKNHVWSKIAKMTIY